MVDIEDRVVPGRAIARLTAVAGDPDAYVREWKQRTGGRVIGAFPMNFPAEIAHAAGLLPVLIQENRETITVGRNLLTEFYCGYTRNIADQAAKGRLSIYDGFYNADHCIQLLGAVDVTREFEEDTPVYFGQLETSIGSTWAIDKVQRKMAAFRAEIAGFVGHDIHDDDLRASIELFNEQRRLLRRFYDERRSGNAYFSPAHLQVLVKSGMVMDRAEHIALLQEVLQLGLSAERQRGRIKVHLSGHFCHAPRTELLELIEECGAQVVDDDLFHGTRWIAADVPDADDPIEAMALWYLARNVAVPCPTRVQHDVDWDGYLLDVLDGSGAEGLIVLMAKFCEPHMLYYPELRKALDSKGIPHLLIETEHEGMPLESMRTRIEALLERIRRRQAVLV
ncbi:2-hydroxyacyl-CoA dehydratase [Nakamurella sp. YIM 132087]|uniref:2-hydroxyacyl-CoA dehydratase n=1 Tax=Nakamurella alba TaxID=2665158 RepID=A0A7K1FEH0_9ACTN|nr:2-hydroxyacyl-CoA dehydratase family protein [Nakamurella alba]MTD12498.1 2-hydroxyacyl-CoA dehydratase [Nakamurella alba]